MRILSAVCRLEPGDTVRLASGVEAVVISLDGQFPNVELAPIFEKDRPNWKCHPYAIRGILENQSGTFLKVVQSTDTKCPYHYKTEY